MNEWVDESMLDFVPGVKEKIPALESGGLGSDPHSAFMGCVLLDMLLNLSELRCLVCKMEI